jgi:hypothetical protein
MTVWLDLMATPNNHLGTLEQYGNTVTPESVRQVIGHIAKNYDSKGRLLSIEILTYVVCDNNPGSSRRNISKNTFQSQSARHKIRQRNQG